MQRKLFSLSFILLVFFCSMLFLSQCNRPEPEDPSSTQPPSAPQPTPELADYMGKLQYYTHKVALSIAAENQDAAAFYFHEVRALVQVIKKEVPGYEGYNIARFIEIFLEPEIIPLNNVLAKGDDWQDARTKLITLIDACNTCHRATSHGFVEVTPGFDKNPYNQVFSAQ